MIYTFEGGRMFHSGEKELRPGRFVRGGVNFGILPVDGSGQSALDF
jgi:hypothetical protein